MNTSFPSAASDFGAFLAGGKQPNGNANLKGIFAALGCAKNGAPDSFPAGKSNFDAILDDAPAVGAGATGLATHTAVAGGISDGETAPPVSDNDQSDLAGRFGAIVTTLQIKGMDGGCAGQSVPQTVVLGKTPERSQALVAQKGIQSDQNTASADTTAQSLNADMTEIAQAAQPTACSSKETSTGTTLLRQIKMVPGRGQSSRGRDWNPALVVHTGTRAKPMTPSPTDSAEVQPVLPATSDSAPAVDSLSKQTSAIAGAVILPVVPLEQFQAVVLKTADDALQADFPSSSESAKATPAASLVTAVLNEPTAIIAGEPATALPSISGVRSVPTESTAVLSDQTYVEIPENVIASGAASSDSTTTLPITVGNGVAIPATPFSTQVSSAPALPAEPTPVLMASTDVFAPVVDGVATASSSDPSAQVEKAPTAPELRRDVVETVAAMLAPFLMNLPALQPELMSNASGALSGDGAAAGQASTINSTVTVKMGAQPPFQFELSPADFSQGGTNDLTGNSKMVDESADIVALSPRSSTTSSDRASLLPPMAASLLTDETPPLDFRIQIKAKIDSAWQQSNQPSGGIATAASQNSALADGNPAIPAGIPPAVTLEATPKTGDSPVEVTIKFPGLGTVTAQIVASDAATNVLEKKPALRSSRMEKTAVISGPT